MLSMRHNAPSSRPSPDRSTATSTPASTSSARSSASASKVVDWPTTPRCTAARRPAGHGHVSAFGGLHGQLHRLGFRLRHAARLREARRAYLQDGVWSGERLLPRGWVDYALAPTHAGSSYAACFRSNADRSFRICRRTRPGRQVHQTSASSSCAATAWSCRSPMKPIIRWIWPRSTASSPPRLRRSGDGEAAARPAFEAPDRAPQSTSFPARCSGCRGWQGQALP